MADPVQEVPFQEDGCGCAEQLDRIEAKLDHLIVALAEDEEADGPTEDLEGNPLPAARDELEPL